MPPNGRSSRASDGDDNVPGFEFVQRVTTTAFRALAAHGEEVNEAWSQIREGTYDSETAMKSWTRLAENYFGVFVEFWRGPSPMPRPAWLVVPYSIAAPPVPEFSVRIDGNLPKGTPLAYTRFEGMGSVKTGEGIFDGPPEAAGTRVKIRLNHGVIKTLDPDTDLVAIIFREGMGSNSPLVIVVLRVTA